MQSAAMPRARRLRTSHSHCQTGVRLAVSMATSAQVADIRLDHSGFAARRWRFHDCRAADRVREGEWNGRQRGYHPVSARAPNQLSPISRITPYPRQVFFTTMLVATARLTGRRCSPGHHPKRTGIFVSIRLAERSPAHRDYQSKTFSLGKRITLRSRRRGWPGQLARVSVDAPAGCFSNTLCQRLCRGR